MSIVSLSPSSPCHLLQCKSLNKGTRITRVRFGLATEINLAPTPTSSVGHYSFRDPQVLTDSLLPSCQGKVSNCAAGTNIPWMDGNSMNGILISYQDMSRSPSLSLYPYWDKSNSNLDEAFSIRSALGASWMVKTESITWILKKKKLCVFWRNTSFE